MGSASLLEQVNQGWWEDAGLGRYRSKRRLHDGADVVHEQPVRILPGAFKLFSAEVPGMRELCDAFKAQYRAKLEEQKNGGIGRTPGTRPGATPMGGTPLGGGRTPGGYGGGRTPGAIGGRTPGMGGATPGCGSLLCGRA